MHQFHQFARSCDDHLFIFVGPYFAGVFDLIGIAKRRFIVIKCLVVFLSLPPVEVSAQQIDIIGQHLFVDAGFSSLISQLENDAICDFVEFFPAIAVNGKPVANDQTSEEGDKIDEYRIHDVPLTILWFICGCLLGYGVMPPNSELNCMRANSAKLLMQTFISSDATSRAPNGLSTTALSFLLRWIT